MKVLVTGGSGFIGSHLVERLKTERGVTKLVSASRKEEEHLWYTDFQKPFTKVSCNLREELAVSGLMSRYKPDVVFHLAGNPLIKEDETDPTDISRANILSTHNLLACAKPGCRFVYASSAAVYGNLTGRGDWISEKEPTFPNSVYGATKVAGEALVGAYNSLNKVSGLSLRLVANAGAGATHGVVADILKKLQSDNPVLELLGDCPGSSKPILHVSDTVNAFIKLGLHTSLTGVINVSTSDNFSVGIIAATIMAASGICKPVIWLGEAFNWPGDNRMVRVCNKLATDNGWHPHYDSRQAVYQATVDILQSQRGKK